MRRKPADLAMRLLTLLCLAAAPLWAQTTAAPPSASVEGVVTDALTGLPLPEVVVGFNGPGNVPPVKTDEQGRYVGRGLVAAQYQVFVARAAGYSTRSVRVRLGIGQELKGVDLKLDKEAVLAGRVLDKDTHPVIGARVSIRGQGYRGGRPTLTSFRSVITNDLGEFRITGLNPGKYYLEAEPKTLTVRKRPPDESSDEKAPVLADVRTYYGNTSSFDGAMQLNVTSGQITEGFDITLLREQTVCVSSNIEDTSAQSGRASVTVSELMPGSQSRVATGAVPCGEEFEICGLPPGGYRLWSFTTSGGPRYASQTFALAGRPLRLPKLTVAGTATVRGKISVTGAKPEDPLPAAVRLRLDVKDRIAIAGEDTMARLEPTGDFTIPGALYDDYWLEVFSLPAGYYVKEATQNGKEALRDPVRAGEGDLNIVLGSDGPSLSGQVVDRENRPVPNAAVVLSVAPLPQAMSPGQMWSTVTDQNGQFTLNNMAPGEYRLMAFADLPDSEVSSPDFVRANLAKATEVTLAPHERKSQSVTVLSGPPGR
jgi:protocatechuate 3,4-dioxygenase beta subunit